MWGADEPGYKYLREFSYAVAAQEEEAFYRIIQDENLSLKGNVLIDVSYIKSIAECERKSKLEEYRIHLKKYFAFYYAT